MHRLLYPRLLSLWSLLLAVALLFPAGAHAQASDQTPDPPDTRPNILWISLEDLSPRLGAYGDEVARTPRLDQLADEGLVYENAFTTSGVCAPSRSAIITGMYQTAIGTHHMRTTHPAPGLPTPYQTVPPPYVKTFTEYLRADGYFAVNNYKSDYQFAPISDPSKPLTAWDVASKEASWRDRPEDMPFFASYSLTQTHESQLFPRNDEDSEVETDTAAVDVPPYYPDTPPVRIDLARHYDNIAEVDRQVGRIIDRLEADGLLEETIVFVWGDHGDGLPRAKRWVYDAGIHVPLIARIPEKYRAWAGAPAPGAHVERLVSLMDMGPTVLSLTGVRIPAHMQGRAFLGPQAQGEREHIFAARDRIDEVYDMVRTVRGKRFQYIRNFYPEKPYVQWVPYRNQVPTMQELLRLRAAGALEGPQKLWMRSSRPAEELYDTKNDPHQISNLAGDPQYRDVLGRMRGALGRWMERTDDLGTVPETQMVRRMWPDMEQPTTHAPIIIPSRSTTLSAELPEETGGTFAAPMEVTIYSPTQGASIAYTTEEGKNPRWKLYTGPIRLTEGATTIRAKAIRYGYELSDEASAEFVLSPDASTSSQ